MFNYLKLKISSLFPKHCAYCDCFVQGDKSVCSDCSRTLPRITGEVCNKCGIEKKYCNCKGKTNYYIGIAAPFYYEDNVKKGIHTFKFRKIKESTDVFALEMYKCLNERFAGITFDFITEVPMYKPEKSDRGFNQCTILAQKLSELSGIQYIPGVLKKIYKTDTQHLLKSYLRRGNLSGVFDATDKSSVENKVILLIDDVSTSGETLNECSKMLWLNDAKAVYCLTLALTKPIKSKKEDK